MYATVHRFRRSLAEETDGWGQALAADLHPGTGSPGTCTLAELGGATGLVVALWNDRGTALAAADHRAPGAGRVWVGARVYEVVDVDGGNAEAGFAQATWFDGPISQAQADASMFAGRERVRPAVRKVDGYGGVYVLVAEDNSTVVFGFADSTEALEAGQKAIMSTELLPGEDPALLPGPHRVDIHRVLHTSLPSLSPATAGEPR